MLVLVKMSSCWAWNGHQYNAGADENVQLLGLEGHQYNAGADENVQLLGLEGTQYNAGADEDVQSICMVYALFL